MHTSGDSQYRTERGGRADTGAVPLKARAAVSERGTEFGADYPTSTCLIGRSRPVYEGRMFSQRPDPAGGRFLHGSKRYGEYGQQNSDNTRRNNIGDDE